MATAHDHGPLPPAVAAWTLLPLPGTPQPGPPAVLTPDPLLLAGGLLALLAVAGPVGWLAGALGSRVHVADELRALA